MQRKDEFLTLLEKTSRERGYKLMILMLTDVLLEGTQLLLSLIQISVEPTGSFRK